MHRVAFLTLWILVCSMAWEEMVEIAGFGRISRLIGLVAFLAGVASALFAKKVRPLILFHGVVGLFIAWSAASIFWSVNAQNTYQTSLTYLQLALLLWLIWELAPTAARQHALLQAYVVGAYLSATYTIALYLTSTAALKRYAASGYNANDLGFTLVLALPMAWYLALSGRQRAMVWLNRLYLPVGLVAVSLTASRGAAIPAAVALLLIPWTLTRRPLGTKIAIAVLLAGSIYFLINLVPATALERLATIPAEIRDGSFSARGRIWRAGWEVFLRNPIVGVGAGNFAEMVESALGEARSPHQSFLSVLVGQGLIGLALFLAIFAVALLPVPRMPPLQRKFWTILVLTLLIGLLPRTWDRRKPTWLVLGVLAVQAAAIGTGSTNRTAGPAIRYTAPQR
jgi:O-antigen ligase